MEPGKGLVITRKPGESILINKEIEITVTVIKGQSVRILIQADKDKYKIDRKEKK